LHQLLEYPFRHFQIRNNLGLSAIQNGLVNGAEEADNKNAQQAGEEEQQPALEASELQPQPQR